MGKTPHVFADPRASRPQDCGVGSGFRVWRFRVLGLGFRV